MAREPRPPDLEPEEAGELYGLPLSEFVSSRDELARALRKEGRRDEAEQVASLRKPTVAAWALDQVARTHPKQVQWLVQANRRLREARTGEAMREAASARHSLVDDLVERAAEVLERAAHSSDEPVRERIAMTLLATATDPEAERALEQGRLVREVEPAAGWPEGTFPPTAGDGEPGADAESAGRRLAAARARELADEAKDLEREAVRARRQAEEAERRLRMAEREAAEAAEAARAADERAEQARRRAEEAAGLTEAP